MNLGILAKGKKTQKLTMPYNKIQQPLPTTCQLPRKQAALEALLDLAWKKEKNTSLHGC